MSVYKLSGIYLEPYQYNPYIPSSVNEYQKSIHEMSAGVRKTLGYYRTGKEAEKAMARFNAMMIKVEQEDEWYPRTYQHKIYRNLKVEEKMATIMPDGQILLIKSIPGFGDLK